MSKRFDDAKRYTKKYREKLLPCRYCGGKKIWIASERSTFMPRNVWIIGCENCKDCGGYFTSVREAVKQWNSQEFRNITRVK